MNQGYSFLRVSPTNDALNYLAGRIRCADYRGPKSSQHNRYEVDDVHTILSLLHEYAPNRALMPIRTTDLSKRSKIRTDEARYTEFCEACKSKTGIGTVDAMRKNLFPDFHRMQLIERYDKNRVRIDPHKRHQVKFVSLSELGLKYVQSKRLIDRYFIFARCVDQLLPGRIGILLDIMRNTPFMGRISIHEYMFFMDAVDTKHSFSITVPHAIDLTRSYRLLSRTQRRSVVEEMKKELRPKEGIPKPDKKDYHNWLNKAQQAYYLLRQTPYFDVEGDDLVLKSKKDWDTGVMELSRSKEEKNRYFREHGVKKRRGFEVHHVVPLAWATSAHDFKLLDDWKNMVYIDGYNHSKITQNGNRNVIMESDDRDILLRDYGTDIIRLAFSKNILYGLGKQATMLRYNKDLTSE